jgi:RNA polymerase sigma-70 factor (ECF subfamily)
MTAPILYVEDEEDYQLLVQRILNRAGLEVQIAENGKQGMEMLRCARPSLLLLDINLPDTDGYAFCRELRQDPAWEHLPILMLTVRRRPEEWLRGFSSGANDYVAKPLNPPELVERVVNCLEGKVHGFTGKGTAEYNLIRAAVAGNRAAFEVLIQKYRERLTESLRYAFRDVPVDDVVSDALVTAYEKLGEFRGEASFYTWIYRIAMNESIGVYRRSGSPVSLDELASADESHLLGKATPPESLDETLADQEINHLALEALEKVPPLYRRVLEMYFLQDLSYDTIAKTLRIPEGTVMSRLHKGRKLLQDAWRREYHASGKRDAALVI